MSVGTVPADEPAEYRERQVAFRRLLLDAGLTAAEVASPAELELAVYQALVELGPMPDAPARLAEAQALLAPMPTDVLPERGALPAGSRMPLAPNPLFVGRGDELLQVARGLRGGDTTVALGQESSAARPAAAARARSGTRLSVNDEERPLASRSQFQPPSGHWAAKSLSTSGSTRASGRPRTHDAQTALASIEACIRGSPRTVPHRRV